VSKDHIFTSGKRDVSSEVYFMFFFHSFAGQSLSLSLSLSLLTGVLVHRSNNQRHIPRIYISHIPPSPSPNLLFLFRFQDPSYPIFQFQILTTLTSSFSPFLKLKFTPLSSSINVPLNSYIIYAKSYDLTRKS
jgi:hypothetical protein